MLKAALNGGGRQARWGPEAGSYRPVSQAANQQAAAFGGRHRETRRGPTNTRCSGDSVHGLAIFVHVCFFPIIKSYFSMFTFPLRVAKAPPSCTPAPSPANTIPASPACGSECLLLLADGHRRVGGAVVYPAHR